MRGHIPLIGFPVFFFRKMNNNFVLNHVEHGNIRNLARVCASSNRQQLEAVDFYGNTALLKSCYLGNIEAVRVLLSFQVNLHAINYFGQNALTLATYAGCYDTVCELLKYRNYDDFLLSSMIPPLCVAVLKGHHHLVQLFQNIHPGGSDTKSVHGLTAKQLKDMINIQQI